jgi:hypothetical protein
MILVRKSIFSRFLRNIISRFTTQIFDYYFSLRNLPFEMKLAFPNLPLPFSHVKPLLSGIKVSFLIFTFTNPKNVCLGNFVNSPRKARFRRFLCRILLSIIIIHAKVKAVNTSYVLFFVEIFDKKNCRSSYAKA